MYSARFATFGWEASMTSQTPDMQAVVERLDRLERQPRRLKQVALLALVAITAFVA
jgi:hypothetical protein